jgi:triacylglycerol lipase
MKFSLPHRSAFLIIALAWSALPASAASTYTQSRYPVVLVHGLLGFDTLLGVLDYFHGIEAELRDGGAQVYVVNLSAANSNELRGEQLLQELENLSALTGATKFNLIGHSQGGLSGRYVAAVRPELVASVTTIGTPHQGSAVSDGLQKLAPAGSPLRALVQGFTNALATLISALSGHANPQDALAAFQSLSSAGANVFNQRFPQGAPTSTCGNGPSVVNGIAYFSFGGAAVLTNVFDIGDAILGAGALFFGGVSNDGLVSECSSKWGRVIRSNLPWNHLDEVNQIVGIRGIFSPEPSMVYRSHVNRLKNLGL